MLVRRSVQRIVQDYSENDRRAEEIIRENSRRREEIEVREAQERLRRFDELFPRPNLATLHDGEAIEVDFSDTPSNLKALVGHLIRDKLWLAKDGGIFKIEEMSDKHINNILRIFEVNLVKRDTLRDKMVENILEEYLSRKITGKKVEDPKPTKRRIKI